ncbi:HIT family protein [Candidatus Woesearchaeota archaeon]|nr:HIT family protein [Candidatus Woesearchaeota archaeon]
MPKESCPFCQIVAERKDLLYEDEKIVALLHKMPSTQGHVLLMPKEHYPIIEQVPDYVINHIFVLANTFSTLLFETLQVQGTNIIVNNGIEAGQETAHFIVNVIPRIPGDGLNLQWQPKQISDEEMSTVELLLKEEAKHIGEFEKEKKILTALATPSAGKVTEKKGQENYLLKHWRRMP